MVDEIETMRTKYVTSARLRSKRVAAALVLIEQLGDGGKGAVRLAPSHCFSTSLA